MNPFISSLHITVTYGTETFLHWRHRNKQKQDRTLALNSRLHLLAARALAPLLSASNEMIHGIVQYIKCSTYMWSVGESAGSWRMLARMRGKMRWFFSVTCCDAYIHQAWSYSEWLGDSHFSCWWYQTSFSAAKHGWRVPSHVKQIKSTLGRLHWVGDAHRRVDELKIIVGGWLAWRGWK